MSRTLHEAIGDRQYPPQSAPTQVSQGVQNFVDGSGPIFSMYLEMAVEEDKKMAEGWKADADGILIFTGLFSAVVASFISVSIQDIRPNPQDTSNFYLANIYYQTITNPNRSNIPTSLPASPPPFFPPNHAVWVNALWFLSLVISLTCALLATFVQQWARRYLKITHSHYSLQKRARIRAFFAEGAEKLFLPRAVETLPTLLHISLFLFFAGLVVFLCNIDPTIFKLSLSWIGICTALYGCITLIPIFRHDSPYNTSLSSLAWFILFGMLSIGSQVRWWLHLSVVHRHPDVQNFRSRYYTLLLQGMQKTAEETALKASSEIDTRAFLWTFDRLDEDEELERFFSGLPGFRSSKVVDDPLLSPTSEQKLKLFLTLIGLLDRTFSSDFLPEPVKNRRAVICAKAINPAEIPDILQWIFKRMMSGEQHSGLRTAEFGHIVRGWVDDLSGNGSSTLVAQALLTGIVATAKRRNDSWFILASDELGIPETVLRDYAADGDNLSLAILIHITRQQFSHRGKQSWPKDMFSEILEAASKFNVRDTSPALQHDFCALWNQIVLEVHNNDDGWMAFHTLGPIRNIYLSLHHDVNSTSTQFFASTYNPVIILLEPFSYPFCNIPGHHSDWTLHNPDDSTSTTCAVPRTSGHDNNTTLFLTFLPSSPDAPPSLKHAPLQLDENPTDVP